MRELSKYRRDVILSLATFLPRKDIKDPLERAVAHIVSDFHAMYSHATSSTEALELFNKSGRRLFHNTYDHPEKYTNEILEALEGLGYESASVHVIELDKEHPDCSNISISTILPEDFVIYTHFSRNMSTVERLYAEKMESYGMDGSGCIDNPEFLRLAGLARRNGIDSAVEAASNMDTAVREVSYSVLEKAKADEKGVPVLSSVSAHLINNTTIKVLVSTSDNKILYRDISLAELKEAL